MLKEQNNNENENKEKEVKNNINNDLKNQNYKNIISNIDKFRLKTNIILKISNHLINNRINFKEDDCNDLDFLQMIDILNNIDKSFSRYSFENNKYIEDNANNNNKNLNNKDFYYQQEFNIIQNIYTKIKNDYNINFNESLERIKSKFINISNKQMNSNSQNKYNNNSNNYYYIYNILYDFIILLLILSKNDINNKEIKLLSPVDRIFLCENDGEQKFICNLLKTYLDMASYINEENNCQELKSIYFIIELFSQINILKRKIKSNNYNNKEEEENNIYLEGINNEIKNDDTNYKNYNYLNHQDFYKIILKKDFIISQLEAKFENLNRNTNNENTFRDLEEENEINKKEIEEMKRKYDLEFELMASAVYGLGINLFFNKEQQLNEQLNNNSSWLARQKDYIMEINE